MWQGYILSTCLFNFCAEYVIWNARLDESQAGIKISARNINNLRYADDTTLMAESEEELKSLLMRMKEESEKTDWFRIGKGVQQGWILSPCLFNIYAEYIMWNVGLDESQAGIKTARINQHPQICRWYYSNGRKWQGTREPLDEGERGQWKSWLKAQHSKN